MVMTLAGAIWLFGSAAWAATGDPASSAATSTPPVVLSPDAQEIAKLCRAQISEDTIVAFIGNAGKTYKLSASEVLYLQQQGVTDRVLIVMLNQRAKMAPVAAAAPVTTILYAPVAAQPQPTYVETPPASTVYVIPGSSPAPASCGYYTYSSPVYWGGYYGYSYPGFRYGVGCARYYPTYSYRWGGNHGPVCAPYVAGHYRGGYSGGRAYQGGYVGSAVHSVGHGGRGYQGGGFSVGALRGGRGHR